MKNIMPLNAYAGKLGKTPRFLDCLLYCVFYGAGYPPVYLPPSVLSPKISGIPQHFPVLSHQREVERRKGQIVFGLYNSGMAALNVQVLNRGRICNLF
jgi:hypothetical protein